MRVGVLVEGERRVDAPLLADCGAVGTGDGGRAEAAEPVRGIYRGLVRKFRGQPPDRRVLRRGEDGRVFGAEQVGPPSRPVQQRATGEHRDRLACGCVLQRVSQVRERMPGGGDHPYSHRRPDRHHIAVGDRDPVERHRVGGVHVVGRAGRAGQGQSASDIVVVDVSLEHVGHRDPAACGQGQYPVDVALRVYDKRGRAVGDQVAPVAQRRRWDRDYVGHCCPLPLRLGKSRVLLREQTSLPRRRWNRPAACAPGRTARPCSAAPAGIFLVRPLLPTSATACSTAPMAARVPLSLAIPAWRGSGRIAGVGARRQAGDQVHPPRSGMPRSRRPRSGIWAALRAACPGLRESAHSGSRSASPWPRWPPRGRAR